MTILLQPTREAIRAVLEAEQLERQKREAERALAHVSDDDLEAWATFAAGVVGPDADEARTALNIRLELDRRTAKAAQR